jgi:hypothetical protein
MDSAQLLSSYEHCNRKGWWSTQWERHKISDVELLQRAIRAGLMSDRKDFNIAAGEEGMALGAEPGLETGQYNVFDQVVHLCCLADIICAALRGPKDTPWVLPAPVGLPEGQTWHSGAFLSPDGLKLRRIALVSAWGDDRHYAEARSWQSLGEVAAYNLPMQQAVIILGPSKDGKRHGHLSKGIQHPANKKLRFRKRVKTAEPFKQTWVGIWRENHDEISTQEWLAAMREDGVLQDVCFSVEIPVLGKPARDKIRDLAARKLEEIYSLKRTPDPQLTGCSWPVKCSFLNPCHAGEKEPNGRYGFDPVQIQDPQRVGS